MSKDTTIRHVLRKALETWGLEKLDAEVLLAHVLGKSRAWIITHLDDLLDAQKANDFFDCCIKRASGIPLSYITGKKEFYGLDFIVTPDVLIPRPETELLIDTCLSIIKDEGWGKREDISILDIGTGSGNIAVTLAVHVPRASIIAVDISQGALRVAQENALRHGVLDRITFIESDLFSGIPDSSSFDFIITNPPYVDVSLKGSLQRELSFEPDVALYAEEGGLSILRKILRFSRNYLKKGGYLISEIGHDQASRLIDFISSQNLYKDTRIIKDLAGLDRVLVCRNL